MTRIEPLEELAAKIEAGTYEGRYSDLKAAGITHNTYGINQSGHVWDAYHGSLDAALAFHNAVLPTWTRSVDATAPEMGIDVWLRPPVGSSFDVVKVTDDDEARALLLADLKALIEKEKADG